jgi:hypothetical protein
MREWPKKVLSAFQSNETYSLIFCSKKGRARQFTFSSWQLKSLLGLAGFMVLGFFVFGTSSLLFFTRNQNQQSALVMLKRELFAYQVRFENIFEVVYQRPDSELTTTNLADAPNVDDSIHLPTAPIRIDKTTTDDTDMTSARQTAANSIYEETDSSETNFSRLTTGDFQLIPGFPQSPNHWPIQVAISGYPNRSNLQITLLNQAFPQTLELQLWLEAKGEWQRLGEHAAPPTAPPCQSRKAFGLIQIAKLWQEDASVDSWPPRRAECRWQQIELVLSSPTGDDVTRFMLRDQSTRPYLRFTERQPRNSAQRIFATKIKGTKRNYAALYSPIH